MSIKEVNFLLVEIFILGLFISIKTMELFILLVQP